MSWESDWNTFTVHEYRYHNKVHIWVGNMSGNAVFNRSVRLTRYYFGLSSPAERIRNIRLKAQRKADKLNHREMYISHEEAISKR